MTEMPAASKAVTSRDATIKPREPVGRWEASSASFGRYGQLRIAPGCIGVEWQHPIPEQPKQSVKGSGQHFIALASRERGDAKQPKTGTAIKGAHEWLTTIILAG